MCDYNCISFASPIINHDFCLFSSFQCFRGVPKLYMNGRNTTFVEIQFYISYELKYTAHWIDLCCVWFILSHQEQVTSWKKPSRNWLPSPCRVFFCRTLYLANNSTLHTRTHLFVVALTHNYLESLCFNDCHVDFCLFDHGTRRLRLICVFMCEMCETRFV